MKGETGDEGGVGGGEELETEVKGKCRSLAGKKVWRMQGVMR